MSESFAAIFSSANLEKRINTARAEEERRSQTPSPSSDTTKRKRDIDFVIRSLAYRQFWRDRANLALASEQASDLAKMLLELIECAQTDDALDSLIKGLNEGGKRTADLSAMNASEKKILMYGTRALEDAAWASIIDVFRDKNYQPGLKSASKDNYEEFDPETVAHFSVDRADYDAIALYEFGLAVGMMSPGTDHGAGEGSHLMVATIAYLRALAPTWVPTEQPIVRESVNK